MKKRKVYTPAGQVIEMSDEEWRQYIALPAERQALFLALMDVRIMQDKLKKKD
jgi:hypothetical protein